MPEDNDLIGWIRINSRAARAARTLVQFSNVVCQMKVSTTTWTHNSKSFILYIYFNGTSTALFAACSVNDKGCKEEAIIEK